MRRLLQLRPAPNSLADYMDTETFVERHDYTFRTVCKNCLWHEDASSSSIEEINIHWRQCPDCYRRFYHRRVTSSSGWAVVRARKASKTRLKPIFFGLYQLRETLRVFWEVHPDDQKMVGGRKTLPENSLVSQTSTHQS